MFYSEGSSNYLQTAQALDFYMLVLYLGESPGMDAMSKEFLPAKKTVSGEQHGEVGGEIY
ncbi:hypothetical protein GIB67_021424, partial [Kingdonia uniflora]